MNDKQRFALVLLEITAAARAADASRPSLLAAMSHWKDVRWSGPSPHPLEAARHGELLRTLLASEALLLKELAAMQALRAEVERQAPGGGTAGGGAQA